MTKKTIPELDDGNTTSGLETIAHVSIDGVSKKLPFMPKPKNLIFARTQADLEASLLGANLEVPDEQTIGVVIDTDVQFQLSKPFQLGENSVLELYAAVTQTEIKYTGTGKMFRLTTLGVPCESLHIHDIFVIGDTTNGLVDLTCTKFFLIDRVQGFAFADLGRVTALAADVFGFPVTDIKQGFRFIDCDVARLQNSGINNLIGPTGITFASFSAPTLPLSLVSVDEYSALTLFTGDSVVFFDPNSTTTSYVVEKSTKPLAVFGGIFYQSGADIAINGVVDNGSGNAQYTTSTSHGLVVGRMVVLSGFATETQNNITHIVTAIISPTVFDTDLVFSGGTDTGNLNQSSIDQTDVRVSAERNPGQQDSMTQAEGRSANGFSFASVIGTFVALEATVPAADDFVQDPATERFIVNDMTGVITYTGISSLTAEITFELTISKSSGGSDIGTLSLFIGVAQQVKTDQILSITSTVQKVSYNGGLFTINPGDTFQLKLNSAGVDTITISALKVLIQR